MTTAASLLDTLDSLGVKIALSGVDRLRVDAPVGSLTPDLMAALTLHKPEVLERLAAPPEPNPEPVQDERCGRDSAADPPPDPLYDPDGLRTPSLRRIHAVALSYGLIGPHIGPGGLLTWSDIHDPLLMSGALDSSGDSL